MAEAEEAAQPQAGPQPEPRPEAQPDPQRPEPLPSHNEGVNRDFVYLPSMISAEFGISLSQARMEIALGEVEIDGERQKLSRTLDLPKDEIEGKEIVVVGQTRHFKMTYTKE